MPTTSTRALWLNHLERIVTPPLTALAAGELLAQIPLQATAGSEESRRAVAPLEILGRVFAGLAPWLELDLQAGDSAQEIAAQSRLRTLAHAALARSLDPASPDLLNFERGGQPLVDAAFLAHAFLRAPRQLWEPLDATTRARLIHGWRASRVTTPLENNWLLFAAMVEAALHRFAGEFLVGRFEPAIRRHEEWYKGDGAYGDGPDFHWDYYNSFVIQPMLLDVLEVAHALNADWAALLPVVQKRAVRFAAVQERLIAPDGSFPVIGRSLTYRCGAFQHLAQMALRQELPSGISAGQIRCALTAVIQRTLEAPNTFDAQGWLTIGLCGHQPGLAENYISCASVYLCSTVFLALGLPSNAPFWAEPDAPWTSSKIWSGVNAPADHALYS